MLTYTGCDGSLGSTCDYTFQFSGQYIGKGSSAPGTLLSAGALGYVDVVLPDLSIPTGQICSPSLIPLCPAGVGAGLNVTLTLMTTKYNAASGMQVALTKDNPFCNGGKLRYIFRTTVSGDYKVTAIFIRNTLAQPCGDIITVKPSGHGPAGECGPDSSSWKFHPCQLLHRQPEHADIKRLWTGDNRLRAERR